MEWLPKQAIVNTRELEQQRQKVSRRTSYKPEKVHISQDDVRWQLSEYFSMAKESAIERAQQLCLEDASYANMDTHGDPEIEVINQVLPIYHQADLWLEILPDMPNQAGNKLAIMYRKERRYRNECEVISAALEYAIDAIATYSYTDLILKRQDRAQNLCKTNANKDNSIPVEF
ncbi:hypothetical protein [Limosilactobacillus fermentum]|uniref:hypothetical protein n=1 Tax=Limosilactobacillus fermentum TaxID=1613 RepID=UPI0027C6BF5A|nr:hypothetical protein [Limosilactobacillus fermentum]MDQ2153675.1 hypothetical protein [Limosilactobacillus fermentum]